MSASDESVFSYSGTLPTGQAIHGTLTAGNQAAAVSILENLGVKMIRMTDAAPAPRPPTLRPLGADDFKSFNQQLILLVKSGMAVEYGLRLLATDMRRGRLARTIATISRELESGLSLPQAIERHRAEFPADYARLLEAGLRSNNLSAVLINLEAHLEITHKFADALRRALYYPMFVALALLAVVSFLSFYVLPLYRPAIESFVGQAPYGSPHRYALPRLTRVALDLGGMMPEILAVIGVLVAAWLIFWITCRHRRIMLHLRDAVACHCPLVGPPLRFGLVARWCDALNLAINSGMNFPEALDLACTITGSPRVQADGIALAAVLNQGAPLTQAPAGRIIPKTAVLMIQAGMDKNNLFDTLAAMGESFRRQAETRLAATVPVLSFAALVLVAAFILALILAVALPLFTVFQTWG